MRHMIRFTFWKYTPTFFQQIPLSYTKKAVIMVYGYYGYCSPMIYGLFFPMKNKWSHSFNFCQSCSRPPTFQVTTDVFLSRCRAYAFTRVCTRAPVLKLGRENIQEPKEHKTRMIQGQTASSRSSQSGFLCTGVAKEGSWRWLVLRRVGG